jgi:hypothetical protein
VFSAWSVARGYKVIIKLVFENLVEFWRWQLKVIDKNGKKGIRQCKED